MSEPMYEWTLRNWSDQIDIELGAPTKEVALRRAAALGFSKEHIIVKSVRQKPPAVCDCAERRQGLHDKPEPVVFACELPKAMKAFDE